MGLEELEVEVVVASMGERRRMWVTAIPGIRAGRRVRIESAEGEQWWRITQLGRMRLREPQGRASALI